MQIGIHFFQVTFLVTVKTNYRTVAYHNWAHGFHVCNSICSILKASPGIGNPYEVHRGLQAVKLILLIFEALGLWVGAICHDIDHRGFNNKFMIDIGSPLSAVYSTSTMENHHFSMGVSILQQVGFGEHFCYVYFIIFKEPNNIFENLNPDEYKQVLNTADTSQP